MKSRSQNFSKKSFPYPHVPKKASTEHVDYFAFKRKMTKDDIKVILYKKLFRDPIHKVRCMEITFFYGTSKSIWPDPFKIGKTGHKKVRADLIVDTQFQDLHQDFRKTKEETPLNLTRHLMFELNINQITFKEVPLLETYLTNKDNDSRGFAKQVLK